MDTNTHTTDLKLEAGFGAGTSLTELVFGQSPW